ncbi:MAG TPA: BPSL0067 family protein [Acetobacteraceae bacterium]|nr:BPSL0067 family protein [Acetobacteraceae bacterium]
MANLENPPEQPAGSGASDFYIADNPASFVGQRVGDGECVAYVRAACPALPNTHQWKKGVAANGGNLPSGTIIATFRGSDGGYNASDGLQHAAVFLSETPTGLRVLDQFNAHGNNPGQHVQERPLPYGNPSSPVNDGNQFYAILKA